MKEKKKAMRRMVNKMCGCEECDKIQKSFEYVSFVRVDKANVMIIGCREHLGELIKIYRLGLTAKKVFID